MRNDDTRPTKEVALEVAPVSALEAIQRGEIDIQIRTAQQYPRSMTKFKTRAIDMATIDEETAESCIYIRPVGKKPGGAVEYAEGLSVRMAEIVGASYGNLRVGAMIIEQTERYVIVRGFAHDLESNFASTSEVKEATVKRDGTPMSEGMRAVIAKAALSKARRDATFQVVPKALCRPVEKAARALIAGDAKSMEVRKSSAVQWIQRLKIDEKRVWAALGIEGPDDITSEALLTLNGLRTAIKEEDTTIDEAFPPIVAAGKVGAPASTGNPMADAAPKPAAKKQTPPAPAPAPAPTPAAPPEEDDDIPMGEETPAPEQPKAPEAAAPAEQAPEPESSAVNAHADAMRKQIITRAKASNIGKAMVVEYFGGLEAWDKLESKALTEAVDNWGETIDAIRSK